MFATPQVSRYARGRRRLLTRCYPLRRPGPRGERRLCRAPDVRQLGLDTQSRPDGVDRFGGGGDEIDAPFRRRARSADGVGTFGFGVPHGFDLQEPTVASR